MSYCSFMWQTYSGRRRNAEKSLRNSSNEVVIGTFILSYEKYKDRKMTDDDVVCADDDFYEGLGASDVLEERHGLPFVLNLMGYREPCTLAEKARKFFTGKYPSLQEATS